MNNQRVAARLVEALELLNRAKGYVNKYPSIGAQELSGAIAEFLAGQTIKQADKEKGDA